VATGAVIVPESPAHARESAPRPDLRLLELLRELSGGQCLPAATGRGARESRRRMLWTIERELPERQPRPSDAVDLDALALALVHCELVTTDAFMVDVLRRTRLDREYRCELYSGRRVDVLRLRDRLLALVGRPGRAG
jgi:hypothetical protein